MQGESSHIFSYRSFVIKLYQFVWWALIFLCLALLRINILDISKEAWHGAAIKAILSTSVPLSLLARMFFVIRPRIFSTYELTEHGLRRKFKNQVEEIEFAKIKKIRFSLLSPRFLGGYVIYLSTGQKYMFLSALRKNHEILKKIGEIKSDLIDSTQLAHYLKVSSRVEVSWQRMFWRLKKWPSVLIKFGIFPLLVTFLVQRQEMFFSDIPKAESFLYTYLLTLVTLGFLILALNTLEERILNKRVKELPTGEFQMDATFEKQVFLSSQILFYLISISIFIYIFY